MGRQKRWKTPDSQIFSFENSSDSGAGMDIRGQVGSENQGWKAQVSRGS